MEKSKHTVSAYAVQCRECHKWRLIPSEEEYEIIRQNFIDDPWFCHKKPNLSCDKPGDIEYDNTRVWTIDKPNIPKSPPGTKRLLSIRSDFSKMDVYYQMPTGKKIRSNAEAERFLEAFPEYKAIMSPADFSFTSPKIPVEMIPEEVEMKTASSRSKKMKTANS